MVPDVMVLLPARNAAGTIFSAVSSTLRALPQDAELFVLDDGSTDDTAALAAAAGRGDSRLRVESRPASGGLGLALNSMLAEADCRLVARMDADDVSLPWRFRLALPTIEKNIDVLFSQVVNFRRRRIQPLPPVGIPPEVFPLHLLLTNPVSHPTMIARRDVVDGYRQVPAEDYDLWLRLAAAGRRMRRLATWGLLYRLHSNQVTASAQWRASSWNDPLQAEAFADLSERLCGVRLWRIVALAQLPVAERDAGLSEFVSLVDAQIAAVPRAHRYLLRRRLAERLAWAQSFNTSHSNHQG